MPSHHRTNEVVEITTERDPGGGGWRPLWRAPLPSFPLSRNDGARREGLVRRGPSRVRWYRDCVVGLGDGGHRSLDRTHKQASCWRSDVWPLIEPMVLAKGLRSF